MRHRDTEPLRFADETTGTQSIKRSVMLLKLLTRRGREGTRLTDLANMAGLPHPTIRRILKSLMNERLVLQDSETRRYHLGPLNFELGLATSYRTDFIDDLKPVLVRLSEKTSDTVYLTLRAGNEGVCIDRIEGASVIRVMPIDIGGRRPLGFGAGTLSIMASLDDAEVEWILDSLKQDIACNPRLTREGVQRGVLRARELGYGVITNTTVIGISAVGVALPIGNNSPSLSISVAMINDRFTLKRAAAIADMIKKEASRVRC